MILKRNKPFLFGSKKYNEEISEFIDGPDHLFLECHLKNPVQSMYQSYKSKRIRNGRLKLLTQQFIIHFNSNFTGSASKGQLFAIGISILLLIVLVAMLLIKLTAKGTRFSIILGGLAVIELILMAILGIVICKCCQNGFSKRSAIEKCIDTFNNQIRSEGVGSKLISNNHHIVVEIRDLSSPLNQKTAADSLSTINEVNSEAYGSYSSSKPLNHSLLQL